MSPPLTMDDADGVFWCVRNAGDMTEEQWRMVVLDNALVHGIVLTKEGARYAREPGTYCLLEILLILRSK